MQTRFLHYVQLLDSALPVGGFSHSFGLETYVQEGKISGPDELALFVRRQISGSLSTLEGLGVKGCWEAAASGDWDAFCEFDAILHVQRVARETREGLHKIGKRLIRLGRILYPDFPFAALTEALAARGGYGTLPSVHAWICCQLGIPQEETVKGYLYTSVCLFVNSALRLMSIGQTEGQTLIRRSLDWIDEAWEHISDLPARELHSSGIGLEIAAIKHESVYSRLFMS